MSSLEFGNSDAGTSTRRFRDLDLACDRFEEALCAGSTPRIEDHIEGLTEPLRSRLLRELISLEILVSSTQWARDRTDGLRDKIS